MSSRGTIEERGPNKFLVRVFLGTDHNGKDQRPSKMVNGSIKEAKKVLTAMLKDTDAGNLVQTDTMSLNTYLDKWLETSVKLNARAKTYREYAGALKRYVRPKLGTKKLQKITTLDVQHVYASMSETGLARATIIHAHAVLREALEQAVKWQFLGRNPANYVDLPKREYKEEMYAMSSEEIEWFRHNAKHSKWFSFFELLLGTGLRPSEALALTWRDINLEKSLLTVTKKLSRKNKEEWSFDDPKSKKGRRSVSLAPSLVALLCDYKVQQGRAGLENPHNLVFPAVDGSPADGNCINRETFKVIIRKADLPERVRLYDLRHTHATLLLAASVHPKIVSERLGHATIAITLDTYSHVLPNMQMEVGEKLESVLYQPPSKTQENAATLKN